MSAPTAPAAAAAGSTATAPGGWRRHRPALALGVLVVAITLLVTLLTPSTSEDALAPDSVAPGGGRALARVLADQGVRVVEERSFDGATAALGQAGEEGATLLVTDPDLLSAGRLQTLAASAADLVLVRPGDHSLRALTDDVHEVGSAATAAAAPGCDVPDAVAAGTARAGGLTYAANGSARSCYGGAYVQVPAGAASAATPARARTTVLGQPSLLTNRWADQDGNAALGLRSLGAHGTLVWYLPDPLDTESPTVPLSALLPRWLWPATAVLALTTVVALLWRGRRLGRLVGEPLPVVVRAAETVEGHGRLYASAGAGGRAAESLRAATLRRLRHGVGLDARASVHDVAEQVAWITGRPAPAVRELLDGPAPGDDPALVRLALDLDSLERDVRGTSGRKAPQ